MFLPNLRKLWLFAQQGVIEMEKQLLPELLGRPHSIVFLQILHYREALAHPEGVRGDWFWQAAAETLAGKLLF